jgi:hypothetical protein
MTTSLVVEEVRFLEENNKAPIAVSWKKIYTSLAKGEWLMINLSRSPILPK